MPSPRKKQRSQLDAINDINVTPLLDLTFLLLIVFMISMPLLETGLEVNTPKLNAKELPRENFRNLTLKADGSLEFERRRLELPELLQQLRQLREENPEAVVLLRGDGERPYREVMDLLREIRNSGFQAVTLVTSPEDPKR